MTAMTDAPMASNRTTALARIMGDRTVETQFAAYVLDDATRFAVTRMVEENPDLNTEDRVGALLWLTTFHGEEIDRWHIELSQEYEMEDILLVIDFLFETAVRTKKGSMGEDSNADSRESVSQLLEFLELYRRLEAQPSVRSVESFADLVDKLGGLNEVLDIDTVQKLESLLYTDEE